jgi:thiamine pyrophosphate-dependent acetolactate synthase large subunit-like protein
MRVLTSQSETGTVTLGLPQDVQTEAFDYPAALFEDRVWYVPRPTPEAELLSRAVAWIRASKKPLIVAGGGLLYSEATEALIRFVEQTGIPVGRATPPARFLRPTIWAPSARWVFGARRCLPSPRYHDLKSPHGTSMPNMRPV